MAEKLVEIRSLSSTGEGVGLYDGIVCFVDGALPGESVLALPRIEKNNYIKADLLSVQKKSPHRVSPPCPLFEKCGGCQIMHLDYEEQLKIKRARVEEAMKRIAKIKEPKVLPCLPSPDPLAYRNKIQMPAFNAGCRVGFGLYAKNSNDIVPVKKCLIQGNLGEKAYEAIYLKINHFKIKTRKKGILRHLLIKSAISTEEVLVVLIVSKGGDPEIKRFAESLILEFPFIKGVVENVNDREDNVILGETFKTVAGKSSIEEVILGKRFSVSPASFFQVNPKQAEKLYLKAIELADFKGNERLLDAYSGVGALSILAASFVKEAVGVEWVKEAVFDALKNAKSNGVFNTGFFAGKVENLAPKLGYFDTVFLNPPRKGCDITLLETLVKIRPETIVYISCDPATLARDAAYLLKNKFTLSEIQPLDMFPQTMHVETVVKFVG